MQSLSSRQTWIPLLLLVAVSLTSCSADKADAVPKGPPKEVAVEVLVAQPVNMSEATDVNGAVQPLEYVEIRPEIQGRIVKLNIKEGATISEGTVLAELFSDDLKATRQRLQSQLEFAERSARRLLAMKQVNGVNEQELDQAQTQIATLRSDLEANNAAVRRTQILAPFSGVLGLRRVSPGAMVGPQDILVTLQQVGSLKVDFNVPEELAGSIDVGQAVQIRSADGATAALANIIAVEPKIVEGTRNLLVRARINSTSNLKPGAFVKVTLNAEQTVPAIAVPSNAIIPESKENTVAVVRNGKAVFVPIVTGARRNAWVEVRTGLRAGDTVVTGGILFLKPNIGVKIRSTISLPEKF